MTLTDAWARHWRDSPGKPVLIDSRSGDEWNGEQLDTLTAHVAAGFAPGERVMVACSLEPAAVIAIIAIVRAGAVAVVANPKSTEHEALHAVEGSGAGRAIISADQPEWGGLPARSASAVLREATGHPLAVDDAAPDQLALISFTSGTTGLPKAVPHTGAELLAGSRALIEAWEWTPRDILVTALPIFHIHGLVVALFTSLTAGGTIVIEDQFTPEGAVEDAARYDATMFFAVPTMWWRIAESGLAPELAGLRLAVSGSAALDAGLSRKLTAALGQTPVERYGMSETLIITSNPVNGPRKPGGVGIPLPGMQLRINSEGIVEVAGPTVFTGYLGGDSGAGFTGDGWFRTGDLGELDADGHLFLRGRASDLIITGGHNVAPAEVEAVLLAQPGVREAAVAGVADPQWGQVIAAYVVLAETASIDELKAACAAELSDFKQPRRWRQLEGLPRNHMGKVIRSELPL